MERPGETTRPERLARRGLGALLVLILFSLAFQLAVSETDVSRLVVVLLQGATLLLALVTSGARAVFVRAAAVVVAASVATAALALVGDVDVGATLARVVTLLLVAAAPVAIAAGLRRDFVEEGAVTVSTMLGVLCVYLLLGMLFSFAFGVVQAISDEPFFAGATEGDYADFLYFSFATITTTGYGDFTAGTDVGRSLAVTEALIGQIYLVTVVAVIVANLRPRRGDRP